MRRCQRTIAGPARGVGVVVDFYRSHLRQIVTIHNAMFQKLLFDEDAVTEMALAELFRDVGKTYLQISQQISESRSRHSLQD
jgi:hypothetical protein